ncbi:MAG: flagellar hook protein FlgE [Acidobacteria bacterium]|nr:flagellar hook protein FlgE [Acidobacteriota bacterium]MBI3472522.1 flagellar hook protein FlgE [Candidatus Solibacter usitatus]
MPLSFSTALSALRAHATALDVVGNNLANMNTSGFKASSAAFRDMVSNSIGLAAGSEEGAGVNGPLTTRNFTQGAIQLTSGALDAAIQGDGFFIVKDKAGNQFYTRNGGFRLDSAGNVITGTGERVQGWSAAGGVVNTSGATGNIVISATGIRAPVTTTAFSANVNLNAAGVVGQATGSFSTPVDVVDSLGAKHTLTLNFTKTGPNAWGYTVTIPGQDLTSGTPGTPSQVATGTLTFNAQGVLTAPAAPGLVPVNIQGFANGAANQTVNWSLYDANNRPRLTQFSQASATSAVDQDGSTAAELVKISMADGGRIVGQYSNGKEELLAVVALAAIRNPESLVGVGDNNYRTSTDTATPVIGLADSGGRGKIAGGALESSTVDIAREFTNLIVYQRGYQANSRVVTTIDELNQETLNLKR